MFHVKHPYGHSGNMYDKELIFHVKNPIYNSKSKL